MFGRGDSSMLAPLLMAAKLLCRWCGPRACLMPHRCSATPVASSAKAKAFTGPSWTKIFPSPACCANPRGLYAHRYPLEPRHLNFPLAFARLGNVVAILHPHERIHRDAESLFEPQRHFRRKRRALVDQGAEGGAGYVEDAGGARYRQPERVNNFALHGAARMGGSL